MACLFKVITRYISTLLAQLKQKIYHLSLKNERTEKKTTMFIYLFTFKGRQKREVLEESKPIRQVKEEKLSSCERKKVEIILCPLLINSSSFAYSWSFPLPSPPPIFKTKYCFISSVMRRGGSGWESKKRFSPN